MEVTINTKAKVIGWNRNKIGLFIIKFIADLFGIEVEADTIING